MAKEPKKRNDIKRGPKGGRKHTPGRGHKRKSHEDALKNSFRKKVKRKQRQERDELMQQWLWWDSLSPEAQRLLKDQKPKEPRPNDEN